MRYILLFHLHSKNDTHLLSLLILFSLIAGLCATPQCGLRTNSCKSRRACFGLRLEKAYPPGVVGATRPVH